MRPLRVRSPSPAFPRLVLAACRSALRLTPSQLQEYYFVMGSIGFPEMVFIFILALLIFGPKKLPELGRSLGKGLSEFRRASTELRSSLEREMQNIEQETKFEEFTQTPSEVSTSGATPVDEESTRTPAEVSTSRATAMDDGSYDSGAYKGERQD